MSGTTRVWQGLLLAALLAGCGSNGSGGPEGPNGGGTGGGTGDGGAGGGAGGPTAATVTVGNDFFRFRRGFLDQHSIFDRFRWLAGRSLTSLLPAPRAICSDICWSCSD